MEVILNKLNFYLSIQAIKYTNTDLGISTFNRNNGNDCQEKRREIIYVSFSRLYEMH